MKSHGLLIYITANVFPTGSSPPVGDFQQKLLPPRTIQPHYGTTTQLLRTITLLQTNQTTRHPHSRTKHPTNNPTTLLTLPIRTHTTNYVEQYQTVQPTPTTQLYNGTNSQAGPRCTHSATVFGVVRNFLARAQSCDMLSQCRLFLLQRGMRGKAWFPLPHPVMRTVVSIS